MTKHKTLLTLLLAAATSGALAMKLPPNVDEARLRNLESELRCLVCQNQSLADSNAGLAQDLRQQVVEQMAAGKTDTEIRDYLVARYGDFVLYKPPMKAATLLLWVGPFLLMLLAAVVGLIVVRRRSRLPAVAETASSDLQQQGERLWQADVAAPTEGAPKA